MADRAPGATDARLEGQRLALRRWRSGVHDGYISEKKRVVNALEPARGDGKLSDSDTDFAVQGNSAS
jgi:hypothetical protein